MGHDVKQARQAEWGKLCGDSPARSIKHFLILHISLGERPRLPSTARVERGPSQGARSASKKGTWPRFPISSKLAYFASLGMALVVVQLRTSSEHIPIVRAPGARDHASVIPRLPLESPS